MDIISIINELNSILQFKCNVENNKIYIICWDEEYNQIVNILVKNKDKVQISEVDCFQVGNIYDSSIRYQIEVEVVKND